VVSPPNRSLLKKHGLYQQTEQTIEAPIREQPNGTSSHHPPADHAPEKTTRSQSTPRNQRQDETINLREGNPPATLNHGGRRRGEERDSKPTATI
jgi:hypothetical protein